MADAGVVLIALALVAIALGALFWGFGRTARHTLESVASFFGALGVLVTIVGFVALVWTQYTFHDVRPTAPGAVRWELANGPLMVIGIGLLVCVGAQILRAVQDRERSRGTHV